MEPTGPATLVLRTLLNFQFLQSVDEAYERGDGDARRLVDDFLFARHPDIPMESLRRAILPFMNLESTLPMLAIPLCYAAKQPLERWKTVGWEVKGEYDIEFRDKGGPARPTIAQLLVAMRNAVAHAPDFLHDRCLPNVSWNNTCVVQFTARRPPSSVTCRTQEGLVRFLSDFIRYTRRLVAEDLSQ